MVRLVNTGSYDFEGRVEVCVNGGWGTVCDNGWDATDAGVLCRQLNLTTSGIIAYGTAQYGQGSGPILLDAVACTGTESSLQSCPYDSQTSDCSHSEDAGVRCHSLPTILPIGGISTGLPGSGQYVYFWFSSWSSAGVTVSITLSSGSVVCYASDRFQTPSNLPGYSDWTLTITNEYTEMFIDPSTLGRPIGSFLSFAFLGQQSLNNFTIQVDSGRVLSTVLTISTVITRSIGSGSILYYNLPYLSDGVTLTLAVSSGRIICYGSVSVRNPSESNYDWKVDTTGREEAYLDPALLSRVDRPRVFIALVGMSGSNTFTLNSTRGGSSAVEVTIGNIIIGSVGMDRFVYFFLPFFSSGITIRIEARLGGIRCYASDVDRRPSSTSNVWNLLITDYGDSFIDPSTLGRTPGSTLFIALQGVNVANNFTMNTTIGDTSIQDIGTSVGIRGTIGVGEIRYYAVPFTTGGITLRLDVSIGYIICYASDIVRNPGPGSYVWLVNARGYADGFVDPSQFGRLGTRYIYIALVGGDTLNTFLLNSTTGNFSSQDVIIGDPVYDSIGGGQFRYYICPFLSGGVTVRVETFRGGVWCYASDTNRNPSRRDYIWRLYISGYNDSYVDPRSLGRLAGLYLYIAIEGIDPVNDFFLNSTTGDTSIADVTIGSVIRDTIGNGIIKFYSLPFPSRGITLSLTVTSGYVNCYASDRYRNPNQYSFDWYVGIGNYWEVYIDPGDISRPVGSFLYVSIVGANASNTYQVNSSSGDVLTVEPQPPTNLQAGNIFPRMATISWSTLSPSRITPWSIVINYRVILTEYAFGLPTFTANSSIESYTFSSLEEFNNYTVVVAAENTIGLSGYSFTLNFSTPQAAPTAPPRNPTSSRVDATPTLITLSWLPPEAIHINGIIDHYEVRVREVYTGRVFTLRAEDATILVGPLHPFYVYECQVAAFTVGLGPFGQPFTAQAGETEPTGPPQNISFATRNASSITLSWDPPLFEHQNGRIRSYSVIVTHANSGSQWQVTTNSSDTNYTIGGLQPFMNYTFSLAAETVALGPYSLTVTIGTVEGVPRVAPDNFTVSVVSATELYASWNGVFTPVGDVRDYIIRLQEVDTGLVFDIRSASTYITIPVHPDYTYLCSVAAVTVGRGPFSAEISVQTPEDAPSGSPVNLTVQSTSPRSLTLTWDPPTTGDRNGVIVSYTINVTVLETEEMFQLSSLTTDLTLSSLRPYYTYLFAVSASTVIGDGPFSLQVTIRMPEDVPTAPESVQVGTVEGQPNHLSVVWQPPQTPNGVVTSYTIYCFEASDEDVYGSGYLGEADSVPPLMDSLEDITSNVTVPGESDTLATVGGLDPFTRYACFVVAATSAGEGERSIASSGVTAESIPTSPPVSLVIDIVGSTYVSLSWLPPAVPNGRIISYTITYNLTGESTSVVVQTGEQYNITGLSAFSYYYFTVFASTVIGDGPPTLPVIQRTAVARPSAAPVNFTAVATGTTSAQFSWDPPSDNVINGVLSHYVLSLSDESFNLTNITVNVTDTSHTLSGLEEYVRYSCRVAAATEVGAGPYSSPVFIVTQQDVPTAPPQSLRGSVESSTLILLWWEPPPPYDRNGEIVEYLIQMNEVETGRFWTLPVFNRKITAYVGSLHPYYRYECRVAANTISLGPYSESIVLQTEEEAPSTPPMAIIPQSVTQTGFTLTWQPPSFEDTNGIIRLYVIQVLEVETGRYLTQTSNITEVTFDGLHPFYSYNCRIAVETIDLGPFSAPITVQLNEDVPSGPPMLTSYYTVDSTSLYFSWTAPPLHQQNGLIRRYDLTLTELETGIIFSYSTARTNFTATLLHPNYRYQMEISAFTIGSGPSSTPLVLQTAEDAPSSPPSSINICQMASDSFTLCWMAPPPQHHNGEITGYNVSVTTTTTGETFTTFSVTNTTTIGSLTPYTTYSYMVAAVTSAGIGPYSTPDTVVTDEAAPIGSPEEVNVTLITSTSSSLTWLPPPVEVRHGVVREYQINVTEVDTGRELVLYSSTPSITISNLHPYYTYLCRVSASTIDYGPFTEALTFTTLEDTPSGFPREVAVSTISSQTVELLWSPPLPEEQNGVITGYSVTVTRRDTGSQFQLVSSTTSISISTLNPFTSYTVTVSASTSVGAGPQSTQLSFTTAEDVPVSAPTNLLGVSIDSRTLSFSWGAPPVEHRNGIIREYRVNITELDTGREFRIVSTTTLISISSLHPYYTYQWAVTAFTVGEGPYSAIQTVSTPQDVPSGAPQSFTAVSTGVTSISLSWQLPLLADRNGIIVGYRVSLSSVSSAETRTISTTDTNITVSSLSPYTTYECIVAAYTVVGDGPPSSIIIVQTQETNPIGTPSNTSGVALNSTHIHLTWDPPPVDQRLGELREYRITIVELETSFTFQLSSPPAVTEATVGPLHPYYTYNCSILAVTVGEGPPSTIITVRTAEDVPSGSPTNFSVAILSSTSVRLSWQPPQAEERNGIIRQYIIRVEPSTGEAYSITTATDSSFVVSSLRPFTSYRFSVAAITIGEGPHTQQIQVQTNSDAPEGPPEAVSAQPLNVTTLLITWEPPLESLRNGFIQRYTVMITEVETGTITTLFTEATNLTVNSLHPYYTYSCIVAAETTGLGPYSHPVDVQLPETAPSSPPVNVQFNEVTSTSFVLSWTAPQPEDHNGLLRHYLVSCTEQESGSTFQRPTTNSTTVSLVDSLHPFYSYTCAVAAVTLVEGPFSPSVTVTTTQDAPTAAPVGLSVISQSSTSVILSWSPPQLDGQNGVITRYSVNVTNGNTGESVMLTTVDTSITVQQLNPFTMYLCSVAAETSIGLGPYTLALTVTTDEDAPVGTPSSLVVVSSTSTSLTLSWSAPPSHQLNGVLRHHLVIIQEVDTGRNLTLTALTSQITVNDLHPFYTYRAAVCPVTVDTGPCAYYNPVQLPQDVPSGPPENIAVVSLNSTSVRLSWSPPVADQQNGIIVEYYINVTEVETGMVSQVVVPGASQWLIDNLHPYYVYNFHISAATSVGLGPFSPVFTVQTPEDAPSSPPLGVAGEVLGPSDISFSWEAPPPQGQNGIIVSYTIRVTEVPTNTTTTYQRDGSRTEILISSLHPFYEHRCRVAAETAVGLGPFSAPVTVTTHQDVPSSPPQSIQGRVVNSTHVRVSWQPPPSTHHNGIIQSYTVSVLEEETMRQFQLTSVTTSVDAADLHPYYTYTITVSAVTIGEGPYSSAISLQTLEDAPSGPPQSFRAVAISSTAVRLTWDPPLQGEQNGVITSYTITITDVESGEVSQRMAPASDYLLVVSSLSPHSTYRCTVAAFTVALGPETLAEVTTLQDSPSGSPRNATVTAIGSTRADFVWLPPSPGETNGIVIGYIVQITGQDSNERLELLTNVTDIQVVDLHPFYSYVFTVAAQTEAGDGPFSSVVYFQMRTAAPIGVVSNVTVTINSPTSVTLSWLPIAPDRWNGILSSYVIQYQRQSQAESLDTPAIVYITSTASIPSLPEHPLSNSPDPRLATLPLNEESLQLQGLEEYHVYDFTVYCENSAGRSDISDAVSVLMPASVPTGAPLNVRVEIESSSSVFVSWQPPEQLEINGIITNYRVVIASASESKQYDLSANSTSGSFGGLEKYTDYMVSVAAATSSGYGPFSTPVAVKTLEDLPGAPTNVEVNEVKSLVVQVSWSPPSSTNGIILDYQVHYAGYKPEEKPPAVGGSQYTIVVPSTGSKQEIQIANLTDGLTYTFKVRARTRIGYGNFSETKQIAVDKGGPISEGLDNSNGGTVAAGVVVAILGWIILVVVIVVVVVAGVWYKRRHGKKELGIPDYEPDGHQMEATHQVHHRPFDTTEDEDTSGEVICNTGAVDDNVAQMDETSTQEHSQQEEAKL